ncbi:hypothetical protein KGMB01110_11650 [Mediterraneibacter butyricigenes]|uniref:DUF4340 domain-containing protein n=1 Tax=Mediterraneibacter butyricigenes TaxID=2316025 RepID=A0A391PAE6_9FIRM|nr:DUF4340 domain-containing protein [Mediterraneibacter butyricigenes]GCA66729.1 hypothetical protein KGMB01110_11650 [Mediterraneibacter butyricigenes]
MEKRTRTLCLLVGAVVLLLVAYFGIRGFNKNQEKKAEKEAKASEIYLTKMEDVTEIRYNIGNGEQVFVKESDSDNWEVEAQPDFPLAQTYPEQIASDFGTLKAERELKDADQLSDYGLEDPVYTVELSDSKGNTHQISIGNVIGDTYYATVDDSQTVYTVSAAVMEDLQYSLEEMAQLDQVPSIGSGNLVEETITKAGSQTTYSADNKDDSEAVAAVIGGLGALTLDTVENYTVQPEELASYGLDEENRTQVDAVYSTSTDSDAGETDEAEPATSDFDSENSDTGNSDSDTSGKEKTYTLYIGTQAEDGTTYVMPKGSGIVYKVTTTVCKNILNQK